MDSRVSILRDALPVAVGQFICTAAMMIAVLLAGSFDHRVFWGGIAGSLISLGNFFLMSFFADLAAKKAAHQDVAGGMALLRLSYLGRMSGLFLSLVFFAGSSHIHVPALALPLVFIRPVLSILEIFRRKGGN